ncbi:hypothetical protein IPA_01635 [Ignicoccus pacificus DSM 13166]|uniref:Uncharacterized protein n=1 Tax=Ignicoccus pacificus DSM 13166 TaxID=940294 RepID=A0A977PKL1_9CREN|nr:hypothetical protein IPA_01635 [Ignicoccus pacificus DSM 13166]
MAYAIPFNINEIPQRYEIFEKLNLFYNESATFLSRVLNRNENDLLTLFHENGSFLFETYLRKIMFIEYKGNIMTFEGPPGSGKSTALLSLTMGGSDFYLDGNRNEINEIFRQRPIFPLAIVDVQVVPEEDSLFSWIEGYMNNYLSILFDHFERSSCPTEAMERVEITKKTFNEVARSLGFLMLDKDQLAQTMATDLSEYIDNLKKISKSGMEFRENYLKFARELRLLLKELRATEHYPLLLFAFDNVESNLKTFREIMTLCKLISVDPLSLCILAIRDYRPLLPALLSWDAWENLQYLNDITAERDEIAYELLYRITILDAINTIEKLFLPQYIIKFR